MKRLAIVLVIGLVCANTQAGVVLNEIYADPALSAGDANADGVRSAAQDEFIELVNTGAGTRDLSGWSVSDAARTRHTFPPGSLVAPLQSIIVFGGGTPNGEFGGALVQVASSGTLSLNNSGDVISLHDALGQLLTQVSYGAEGGRDVALTRTPDLSGPFAPHDLAPGANGRLFSPGTRVNANKFSTVPTPLGLPLLLIGGLAMTTLRLSRKRHAQTRTQAAGA